MIEVIVCKATNDYHAEHLILNEGTTLHELITKVFKMNAETVKVGVYGKLKELSYTLKDKDRVEFYEDIVTSPKIACKKRKL